MKNNAKNQYVTEVTFKNEIRSVHSKIDNISLRLIKTEERVEKIENSMATKEDVMVILNRIDNFTKLRTHDRRISSLESR